MAWANVCPRLSSALTPDSRSSATTSAALRSHARTTAAASASSSRLEQGGRVGFEPVEEVGVVDEPVLHDLGEAGPHLAGVEGGERRGVADHAPRLVEGADEVLAAGKVDAGLAAHRGVHLGEQRGRHLHEVDAALVAGGREPGDVADHSAAERDHDTVARDAPRDQGVLDGGERVERLVPLAVRDDVGVDAGGIGERRAEPLQVQRCHRLVGDHEGVTAPDVRGEEPPFADDAGADVDRVAPLSQVDLDGPAHSASMR